MTTWLPYRLGVALMCSLGSQLGQFWVLKLDTSTVEDDIIIDQVDAQEIIDDFEIGQVEDVHIKDKEANKQKLRRRISRYKIKLHKPCLEGKKLLILDIDYTLFYHQSTAKNPLELMRPYLHEFLSAAYSEYDIIIWSATRGIGRASPKLHF
ncbi:hypothetical protein IFM89_010655 [Coptis chinensis]|uniref:FCP1 homology domain-containing protein n=1 Tax=Coptis chinensis TaxID=261450 RepID=A0A835IMQ6_9MAGN|nr:hypothetical protein IFM89_010655 [Coptis chinensis]